MAFITFNKDEEVIEKLLGIDIRVQTNKDREVILRYSNFKGELDSSIENSFDESRKLKDQFVVKVNCDGYTLEIVEA